MYEYESNFKYNFPPICGKRGKCMLIMAKGNVMIAERSARAPTAHVAVRSCRKPDKTLLYIM
jgi:hypothetical protein